MDLDGEPPEASALCRLFPLPEVVLFPGAVLPLHIFEPRYRQMTEDALADDQRVTIVQIRPGADWSKSVDPEVEPIACLGRILQHERLPDGRFNFLLVGEHRIRLLEEVPKTKLYRRARYQVLDDREPAEPDEPLREELIRVFREMCERVGVYDPHMDKMLSSGLPLGPMSDIIAQSLAFPGPFKQELLAETRVEFRARAITRLLARFLRDLRHREDRSNFPPPFSSN
jgi:Lon protease-like protein